MKKLTVEEAINLLKEEIEKLKPEWFQGEDSHDAVIFREMISAKKEKPEQNYYSESVKAFNLFQTVGLEERIGDEGCRAVLKFNNGQYFLVVWGYYSYKGEIYEDLLRDYNWQEVKPVEVLKTEYHLV